MVTETVPLTGDTLKAALKMRCDTSGASYAIYWANQGGKLIVSGQYKSAGYAADLKSRGVTASFADASKACPPGSTPLTPKQLPRLRHI